jgi:hypothetical protein
MLLCDKMDAYVRKVPLVFKKDSRYSKDNRFTDIHFLICSFDV